jgi:hypothetical protein
MNQPTPNSNSNASRRRNAAMTVLAMTMFVSGTAGAAERGSSRPSASRAGAGSIRFAETRGSGDSHRHPILVADRADRNNAEGPYAETARRRSHKLSIDVMDRNNADGPYAETARRGGHTLSIDVMDRNNAEGPYVETARRGAWTVDDLDTATADRAFDALLQATLRAVADPFGIWADESDLDDDREDAKDSAGDGRPACDPMDRDADGDVDFDDFKSLSEAFGTDDGDLDGDGIVSGSDLGLMLARMSLLSATA